MLDSIWESNPHFGRAAVEVFKSRSGRQCDVANLGYKYQKHFYEVRERLENCYFKLFFNKHK